MRDDRRNKAQNTDERAVVRTIFEAVAGEDPETVRAVLRENAALAEAVLGRDELVALMRTLFDEDGDATIRAWFTEALPREAAASAAMPSGNIPEHADEAPGLFTELTRELSPERAEQLYRKVVPLLVYELLRTLDRSANVALVQQIVEHLCSREVQDRLRGCVHVRDGILDELCVVLRDRGVRGVLNRDDVLRVMEACGITGELMTLVNCIRLIRAAG